jgi:hypothetical protein
MEIAMGPEPKPSPVAGPVAKKRPTRGGRMVAWAIWGGLAALIAPHVVPDHFWPRVADLKGGPATINFLWGPLGALLATLLGLVLFFGILPALLLGLSYAVKKGGAGARAETGHILFHMMRGIGGFVAVLALLGLGLLAREGADRLNSAQGDKLLQVLLAIFLGACGGIVLGAVLELFAGGSATDGAGTESHGP